MIGLTPVQAQCLEFIDSYQDERGGTSPSYDEVADALSLTKSRISRIMCDLEDRGAIQRDRTRYRSIKVLREDKGRTVTLPDDLIELLDRYTAAEGITRELAVRQFIRDGLEGA